MILRRSVQQATLGAILLGAATVACSNATRGHAARPSCPGEQRLVVENNTRDQVEVYMSRPNQRNGMWLGAAIAGRSTMALPSEVPRDARFVARLPNGRSVSTRKSSAVQFKVECPRA